MEVVKTCGSVMKLQQIGGMENRKWYSDPCRVKPINSAKLLPTTVKKLAELAKQFTRSSKPTWHRTEFLWLSVVARLASVQPNLVIIDNTGILSHRASSASLKDKILLKNTYYKMVFELTPYSQDQLSLLKIEIASPRDLTIHLCNVASQAMMVLAHQKLVLGTPEDDSPSDLYKQHEYNKVRAVVNRLKQFTVKDLHQSANIEMTALEAIMERLCNEGLVGNLGNQYIAMEDDYN